MGLQDGKGVEMDLGNQAAQAAGNGDGVSDAPAAEASTDASQEAGATDRDGDIVLDDTKPKEEGSETEDSTATPKTGEESSEAGNSTQAPESEKKD
jgi:hypothetical protein